MFVDAKVSSMKTSLSGSEIELTLELLLATFQDVGTILLHCVAAFLRVIPCQAKKRHSVAMLVLTPRAASISRNSGSAEPGCSIAVRLMHFAINDDRLWADFPSPLLPAPVEEEALAAFDAVLAAPVTEAVTAKCKAVAALTAACLSR
jgi:hypothetical protein